MDDQELPRVAAAKRSYRPGLCGPGLHPDPEGTLMLADLQTVDFVVLDVETTGLSFRNGDRMIEVAGLKTRGLTPVARWSSLIDPCRPLSYGAYLVNRISSQMLAGAPTFAEVLPELRSFLSGGCLVGHNIKFDLGFIHHESARLGEELTLGPCLDTCRMARGLLPELGRFSLGAVAYALGLEAVPDHRAMSDVEVTFEVFRRLLEIAERRDLCELEILQAAFGLGPLEDPDRMARLRDCLKQALEGASLLRISYLERPGGALTWRDVTPTRLTGSGRRARMIGYCHQRGAEARFDLARIIRVEHGSGGEGSDGTRGH